jgi:hypothetical protein
VNARSRAQIWLALLAITATGATACGNHDSRPAPDTSPVIGQGLPPEVDHPAATAIDELQQAFVKRNYGQICAGITREAAEDAGKAAHGSPTTCTRDMRRLFGMIRDGGGWRHEGAPRVIEVENDGSDAVVTVALERRWKARVPMTKVEGRWKLSGFFGTPLAGAERVAQRIPATDYPEVPGKPVRATKVDGTPCPALLEDGYPLIDGGCTIRVSGRIAPVTILTALGDFKFDDCSLEYRIGVDLRGRTWIEDFEVGGDPRSVACGDVNACYVKALNAEVPWRGRIRRDSEGDLVHQTDMCLMTCVGSFIGDLRVRLVPDDDGWRGEPIDGGGDSGLRVDNALVMRGEIDFDDAKS